MMTMTTLESTMSCCQASRTPPAAMTGAATSIVKTRTANDWICWVSLVALVTRLCVPKAATSWEESVWILVKTSPRNWCPIFMATTAPKSPRGNGRRCLDRSDQSHNSAQAEDFRGVPGHDAVVDDGSVNGGQEEVASGLDELEGNDRGHGTLVASQKPGH